MSAVFQMKRSAPALNPHLLGGLALAGALGIAAAGVMLFGDPRAAAPVAVAQVPPPAEPVLTNSALREVAPAPRLLRGDAPGLADPMLDVLAPPPGDAADIILPGVEPLDAEELLPGQIAEPAYAEFVDPERLTPAPVAGLTEPGPGGLLPAIGPDGTRPADAYARPFEGAEDLPRIAVIVGGLGFNEARARRAIEELPPEVTLGFSPYAENLQAWIDTAREAGHEVLIEVPMEPFDYPQNDPGEHTLLTSMGSAANLGRLEWLMSRAAGYFAIMNYQGGKFLASESALAPVLEALAARGVDMIYDGAANGPMATVAADAGLAWTPTDRALDANLTAEGVQSELVQLEAAARQNGAALGAGFAYPVVIDQVLDWTRQAEERGFVLAPASAVLDIKDSGQGG